MSPNIPHLEGILLDNWLAGDLEPWWNQWLLLKRIKELGEPGSNSRIKSMEESKRCGRNLPRKFTTEMPRATPSPTDVPTNAPALCGSGTKPWKPNRLLGILSTPHNRNNRSLKAECARTKGTTYPWSMVLHTRILRVIHNITCSWRSHVKPEPGADLTAI